MLVTLLRPPTSNRRARNHRAAEIQALRSAVRRSQDHAGSGNVCAVETAESDSVLREQRRYYALRAGEYDDVYERGGQHDRGSEANADWLEEMARLQRAFERVPLEGDIIELAAGTGAWTARLIERARSLTVLDASPEMLARNRERLGPASERVVYGVVDLFDWRPTRTWDACVFGFWLCKVPDAASVGSCRRSPTPCGPEASCAASTRQQERNERRN